MPRCNFRFKNNRSRSQGPPTQPRSFVERMSFRRMEVGHRFRRMKHSLQTKKFTDEELKQFDNLMLRNSKVSNFASTFRKDLASTLETGFKEENVDKRKKKVEELAMAQTLREASVDLGYYGTSCLHDVVNEYGIVLLNEVDEKVKLEMAMERRVYEELAPFVDYEKNLNKLKDKLNLCSTDLEIAQKDTEKEQTMGKQEIYDSTQMKYEGMKDALVTDIFASSVSKELQMSEHVLTSMILKRDYFKTMANMYDELIPVVEEKIATALPRPVFGVALEEHLKIQQEKISVVLTKCCDFLKQHGMNERGIFRVSGNASKVKRIRAALDAGQFENDEKHYHNDPHAVASTLKAYLRELPDPLTMESLQNDWVEAVNLEGEDRFAAIDNCLKKMSCAHRQNLTYLMKFLCEIETRREETSMNASNLAIVFAPTITGMVFDGLNAHGVKLTEFLISNGCRIFNFGALDKLDTSPPTFTRAQSSISPRSFRPKEKAPPPPPTQSTSQQSTSHQSTSHQSTSHQSTSQAASTSGDLINLADEDDFSDDQAPTSSNGGSLSRSNTEHRPNRPPPPSFRSTFAETPKSRPISYNIAVGARPTEPQTAPRAMTTSMEDIISDAPVAPERKRLSMLSIGGSLRVVPTTQTSSQESSSGSLVMDGGDNRTLVSINGEPSTSTSVTTFVSNMPSTSASTSASASAPVPSNVQPPPQSTKPKPPVPLKPKDLTNESSRL